MLILKLLCKYDAVDELRQHHRKEIGVCSRLYQILQIESTQLFCGSNRRLVFSMKFAYFLYARVVSASVSTSFLVQM